jgi:hypothetical protein
MCWPRAGRRPPLPSLCIAEMAVAHDGPAPCLAPPAGVRRLGGVLNGDMRHMCITSSHCLHGRKMRFVPSSSPLADHYPLLHWCTCSRTLVAHGATDHEARVLERMSVPAQQIKRWTRQPPSRAAVRRKPDGLPRDHCRSGAETLPGVPRQCTYMGVVGP